jgi:hypothetical protein
MELSARPFEARDDSISPIGGHTHEPRGIQRKCMVTLMTTVYIDRETAISWQSSCKERCSLSRATAEAIRESLRRTTATILKLHELLSQSDETIRRLRTP